MKWLVKQISARPGKFQAVIVSGVALATSFGLDWTGQQVAQVTAFTAILLGFLTDTTVPPSGSK